MRTRAKFYISGLTLLPGQDAGVKVNLQAVARGDRNATWAAATPSGQIEMTVNNPAAAAQIEAFMQAARATGRQPEVFVDFTPSEDGWPGDGHAFVASEAPAGHYAAHGCGVCGMPQDGEVMEWDQEKRAQVGTGRRYHPEG